MAQHAWNIVNDAMRTPLIVRYHVEVLATAALYATDLAQQSLTQAQIPRSTGSEFSSRRLYSVVGGVWNCACGYSVTLGNYFLLLCVDIEEVSRWLLFLYQRPKARYVPLTSSRPVSAAASPVLDPQQRNLRSPARDAGAYSLRMRANGCRSRRRSVQEESNARA